MATPEPISLAQQTKHQFKKKTFYNSRQCAYCKKSIYFGEKAYRCSVCKIVSCEGKCLHRLSNRTSCTVPEEQPRKSVAKSRSSSILGGSSPVVPSKSSTTAASTIASAAASSRSNAAQANSSLSSSTSSVAAAATTPASSIAASTAAAGVARPGSGPDRGAPSLDSKPLPTAPSKDLTGSSRRGSVPPEVEKKPLPPVPGGPAAASSTNVAAPPTQWNAGTPTPMPMPGATGVPMMPAAGLDSSSNLPMMMPGTAPSGGGMPGWPYAIPYRQPDGQIVWYSMPYMPGFPGFPGAMPMPGAGDAAMQLPMGHTVAMGMPAMPSFTQLPTGIPHQQPPQQQQPQPHQQPPQQQPHQQQAPSGLEHSTHGGAAVQQAQMAAVAAAAAARAHEHTHAAPAAATTAHAPLSASTAAATALVSSSSAPEVPTLATTLRDVREISIWLNHAMKQHYDRNIQRLYSALRQRCKMLYDNWLNEPNVKDELKKALQLLDRAGEFVGFINDGYDFDLYSSEEDEDEFHSDGEEYSDDGF